MMKNKGYSLSELAIMIVLIGVISTMAVSLLLGDLPEHKVKNGIIIAEQALKVGKSTAARLSSTVTVNFSSALSNNGDNGGIIQILDNKGNVLESYNLEKNVLLNSGSSTIISNKVIFDFRGQPVDSTGNTNGFTTSNNTIAFSYYGEDTASVTYTLTIQPLTGNVNTKN